MTSPFEILTAYSRGEISSGKAIAKLRLSGYLDLLVAMADAGHPLPQPSPEEIARQLEGALPLLRAALISESDDRA